MSIKRSVCVRKNLERRIFLHTFMCVKCIEKVRKNKHLTAFILLLYLLSVRPHRAPMLGDIYSTSSDKTPHILTPSLCHPLAT